jgi:ArsR family transcriptional regulator, arsenate/arsenite/antimonite-responsive transcriptional repressor
MDTTKAVAALGALAQETRLAIYRLLVQKGPDGLSAGLIGGTLGVPPSSLSFHLAQLAHAGLVNQRRVSRNLFYAADFATMNGLMSYLTENCCGRGAICAPSCGPGPSLDTQGEKDEAPARARRR